MELYLAFNIDDWAKKDMFDYIKGADDILDLIPKTEETEDKEESFKMNQEKQIALL